MEPPEKLGLDYLEKIISEGANSKQTEISQKKLINFRDSYARAEEKVCSTKKQSIWLVMILSLKFSLNFLNSLLFPIFSNVSRILLILIIEALLYI